jgi:hypothetical protein
LPCAESDEDQCGNEGKSDMHGLADLAGLQLCRCRERPQFGGEPRPPSHRMISLRRARKHPMITPGVFHALARKAGQNRPLLGKINSGKSVSAWRGRGCVFPTAATPCPLQNNAPAQPRRGAGRGLSPPLCLSQRDPKGVGARADRRLGTANQGSDLASGPTR